MHEAAGVCGGEAVEQLQDDLARARPEERTAVEQRAQRVAFEEFGDEIRRLTNGHIKDGEDVRMGEGGDRTSFLFEPTTPGGIPSDRLGQHLNRHIATEPWIPRSIDFAHPARAKGGLNLVWAEASAGGKRHERLRMARRAHSSLATSDGKRNARQGRPG